MWEPEHRWLVWIVVSAVLACTEMLSGDFTLLMLAAGAGAGALTAAIVPGMWLVQVFVAAAVAGLSLALLRPTLLRRVRETPGYRSSLDSLVGAGGVATRAITDDEGQVKVNGEEWSARSLEPGLTIVAGQKVEVYEVDGTTLVVYPVSRSIAPRSPGAPLI
ncbi:NfeD family protein [Cutibacterium equinum]|uniref:NfeD family protein n=1 Tax=Cutibacterium equinum TaxID=3016342 RepID=A0ABY7QW39_9ACTN|nr:NfeD family protein [Cutibacterium equinum]WCC79281.1 NfeD family protein [Cutibacterium equinum]